MADIKLPSPQQQGDLKGTVDNLYDTVLRLRKELEFALLNLDSANIAEINTSVTNVSDANGKTKITGALLTMKDNANIIRALLGLDASNVFNFSIYTATGVNAMTLSDTGIAFGEGTSISWDSITDANNNALAAWEASGYKTYIDADGVYTGTIAANLAQIATSVTLGSGGDYTNPKYLKFSNGAFFVSNTIGEAGVVLNASNFLMDVNYITIGHEYTETTVYGEMDFTNATVTGFTAVWG